MQEKKDYSNRFGGIANLYSHEKLDILRQSHACIIGIGGVGSWSVEGLARSGVGTLTLIDMDDICVTNVNRQIHANTESLGHLKTAVMRDRALSINPDCKVHIIDDFLTIENIVEYISTKYDVIIDAIDNARVKAKLIAHCKKNKIKIITTGAAGGKSDISQITHADITKTTQDPLIAKVRRILKQEYHFTNNNKKKFGIVAVYSTEQLKISKNLACKATAKISCNTGLGTITMITATFGFYAASKAIDYLIKN